MERAVAHDTVLVSVRDSVYVWRSPDTVYVSRTRVEYRERASHDTVTVHDTVRVVERREAAGQAAARPRRLRDALAALGAAAILATLLGIILKVVK